MPVSIWGRYLPTNRIERIDTADKDNAALYLVREYQLAYGADWIIWSGNKRDEPKERE